MRAPIASARPPPACDEWNAILVDALFPRGRAGVPVYLAVHDAFLDECGARHGRGGRDDFVGAVLAISSPARLFVTLERIAEVWSENGRGGPPPFVGGLALAVLAAGEMTTDDNATQSNYYVRLNTLLGVDSRERPEKFDCTLELWRLLKEWLRDERRGELIVLGAEGSRRFVDPVKSQCLVRPCDIPDVLPIFRDATLWLGHPAEPEDILPGLRAWLTSGGVRSRLSLLLGRDPDDSALLQAAEALCDVVEDYCEQAPLVIEETRARRPSHALLAIRPNRYPNLMWKRAEWLIRLLAPSDADEPECLVAVGDRVAVARLDVREPATYDAAITMAEAGKLLRRQLGVVDEDGNDVAPKLLTPAWFQDGSAHGRFGSWEIEETPAADVGYAVVFPEAATFAELKEASEQVPQFITGTAEVWPGPGLHAACAVVPKEGAMLPGNIAVQARPRALRLSGGLPIRRRVYLRGALPSVLAPETAQVRAESEERLDEPLIAPAAEIGTLDMAEGRYTLRCEGATAEIFVVEPRWRECVVPQLAPLDQEVRGALIDAGIRGAHVEIQRPIHATYFRAGTHFRVYSPNVTKGVAPVDGGIHEVRTSTPPIQVVITKRFAARGALARADCLAETADAPTLTCPEGKREAVLRLLEYVSARGAGPIETLRAHCASIAGETGSWHSVLSMLEDLGHLDISWETRRWTVTPPCFVPRAADERQAILVGARARQSTAMLREGGVEPIRDERACEARRMFMPDCILAQTDAVSRASKSLADVGLRVTPASWALDVAIHVRPVTEIAWWIGSQFCASSRVRRTLERWVPTQFRWAAHPHDAEIDGPVLYRWREHGVVTHYIVYGESRARVRDPSAAKWLLAPPDRCHLVYEPNSRRLVVPLAIGLPRIWRRICTLASGLMPVRESRMIAYDDIPIDLARAVAIRLNQPRGEGLL